MSPTQGTPRDLRTVVKWSRHLAVITSQPMVVNRKATHAVAPPLSRHSSYRTWLGRDLSTTRPPIPWAPLIEEYDVHSRRILRVSPRLRALCSPSEDTEDVVVRMPRERAHASLDPRRPSSRSRPTKKQTPRQAFSSLEEFNDEQSSDPSPSRSLYATF